MIERILARRRWLEIGIGIKRWLVLLVAGSAVLGMGFVYGLIWSRRVGLLPSSTIYRFMTLQWMPPLLAMILPLLIGMLMVMYATLKLGRGLTDPLRRPDEPLWVSIAQYQRRHRGPKIVAIGGGTGMSNLLRGLTAYTGNITAIVTVADDGGSSGRLRRQFGILPPGDFRNNIAALARDEALMAQLLQYRFGESVTGGEKAELSGHAFGNLLIAALVGLTGSFEEALMAAQRVLAIRGRVLPSTLTTVQLSADIDIDGRMHRVEGESAIPKAGGTIKRVYLEPEVVRAYPDARQAIFKADLVVIGPGSLYTSILPNLLVPDLADALRYSQAAKVYVCNVATQKGETDHFDVKEHVDVLVSHVAASCFDIVLANQNLTHSLGLAATTTEYVPPTQLTSHKLILADLVDRERPWRHDSEKLAAALIDLLRT